MKKVQRNKNQSDGSNKKKYNLYTRIIHWISALVMLGMVGSGIYMIGLQWSEPEKAVFYSLHKSIGMIIIPLFFLRLAFRLTSNTPELPKAISTFERTLSKLGVILLYWFMLVIPVSGYMMSVASGYQVEVFSFKLPSIIQKSEDLATFFHSIHGQIWYFFIALVILHALSSLKHLIYDKVNLFTRIW